MPEVFMDRRVQKTRQLLKDALITLISEKGFEAVTIQDILDKANVGRSTFYFHFENKQELLHSCFEDLHRLIEQQNTVMANRDVSSAHFISSDFTRNLFQLIDQNHRLFKAIFGKDVMSTLNSPIRDVVFVHISETLKALTQNKKADPLQSEILANYLTSAFIGILKWWIDNDKPCTADELDKSFRKFALYDIQQVMS